MAVCAFVGPATCACAGAATGAVRGTSCSYMQATRTGINALHTYRKALLQRQAEGTGLMPEGLVALDMRDYARCAGGPVFDRLMATLVVDDGRMTAILRVLTGGAYPCKLRGLLQTLRCMHACTGGCNDRCVRTCITSSRRCADAAAPPVLLPAYKTVLARGEGHVGRGTCVALAKVGGEFK